MRVVQVFSPEDDPLEQEHSSALLTFPLLPMTMLAPPLAARTPWDAIVRTARAMKMVLANFIELQLM